MDNTEHPRIKREKKTIHAMVKIYCEDKHNTKEELCSDCTEFIEYARIRLSKSLFRKTRQPAENAVFTATNQI